MVCIYCGSATDVTNSRPMKRLNGVWRRRACKDCGSLVTTVEQVELSSALRVKQPNGLLEPFSRDKLYISLYESLGHRKTAQEDAARLCDTVIQHLISVAKSPICLRDLIVAETSTTLQRFDTAAATHYRAYHPLS
jgi:transcriptional regulator NrdR family protein